MYRKRPTLADITPPFSMDRQVQREGRLRERYGRCCEMVGRRGVELK
jgi:hypothetical protein